MLEIDPLQGQPKPATHLANHSTHQIMLAIDLGINLMIDRNPVEAMHYRAGVCILQREIALRVAGGNMGQGLPDKICDYDS